MMNITLKELLEEIQNNRFEIGQYFETIKSFYPTDKISRKDKEVILENRKITLPLACSAKSKKEFFKDKSFIREFFKEGKKGDILEVIETNGKIAKCINRSIKEEFKEKYYSSEDMKYVYINFEDLMSGNIKRVYRGVRKIIE